MIAPEPSRPTSVFRTFFSNPLVGVAGSIASVVGVILAIYFFLAASEIPQLTYFVHPVRSIIVGAGQSSRLSVTFENNTITTDVTAAQVAFWNNGNRSIRRENVLRPFVIRVGNRIPILEARLLKKSRDVVTLELDSTRIQQGELAVTWNILEHNDGGVIQLVFAGNAQTPIAAEAVVEGQRAVEALSFPGTIRSPGEQYARAGREERLQGFTFLGMGVLSALAVGFLLYRRSFRRPFGLLDYVIVVQPLVIVAMAIYFLLKAKIPGPPFGF